MGLGCEDSCARLGPPSSPGAVILLGSPCVCFPLELGGREGEWAERSRDSIAPMSLCSERISPSSPPPKGKLTERPVGGEDGSLPGGRSSLRPVHSGVDVSPDCRISKKSSLSLKHL